MSRGIVNDWRSLSLLWAHVTRSIGVMDGQHPVLLTEKALTPVSQRVSAHEVWFEALRAPAVSVQVEGVLSLFASGRTTGLSVDVGEGAITTVPVFEGHIIRPAVSRSDVGGQDVTERLGKLLRERGVKLHTSADMELVRYVQSPSRYALPYDTSLIYVISYAISCFLSCSEMKEAVCYASPTPLTAAALALPLPATPALAGNGAAAPTAAEETVYALPDGEVVRVGRERAAAAEVLFNPACLGDGREEVGLGALVASTIDKCDRDARAALMNDLVLSGGCTLMSGFGQRAAHDIRGAVQEQAKVRVWAAQDRAVAAWVGGSVLASMPTFASMCVQKKEWEEMGPSAVYRKLV